MGVMHFSTRSWQRCAMLKKNRLIQLCNARDQLRDVGYAERSIDEVAKSAAMSRFHFVRQFKAVFGETPVRFRTRMRLDQAKYLLIESDDSITDICMAVGFSSLGSFSVLFSRRFGRSPSRFRRCFKKFPEVLTPDCLAILRGAWESKPQISRSTADIE